MKTIGIIVTVYLLIGLFFTFCEVFLNDIDWWERFNRLDGWTEFANTHPKTIVFAVYSITMAFGMFYVMITWPPCIFVIPSYINWVIKKVRNK